MLQRCGLVPMPDAETPLSPASSPRVAIPLHGTLPIAMHSIKDLKRSAKSLKVAKTFKIAAVYGARRLQLSRTPRGRS